MAVRFTRLLLVLALLGAWQSALVHPVEHVDQGGQLVHLGQGSDSRDASCDLLSALTVCAPQASAVPQVLASSCSTPIDPACAIRVAEPPPFLSQGPPAAV